MSTEKIIANTISFVKEKIDSDSSGHDWWHTYRVWINAKNIMEGESVDFFVVELAALLHDIADYKLNNNDMTLSDKIVTAWLKRQSVEQKTIKRVCCIINEINFRGANVKTALSSLEAKIVQDADRLDAIGAIGIARAFSFGGYFKQKLYDPDKKPNLHNSFEEYKKRETTGINHFYEKLLLLKDLMNTDKAKHIAIERHQYMKSFLERFFQEIKGEK